MVKIKSRCSHCVNLPCRIQLSLSWIGNKPKIQCKLSENSIFNTQLYAVKGWPFVHSISFACLLSQCTVYAGMSLNCFLAPNHAFSCTSARYTFLTSVIIFETSMFIDQTHTKPKNYLFLQDCLCIYMLIYLWLSLNCGWYLWCSLSKWGYFWVPGQNELSTQ